jgi:hypothetical protein
MAVQQYRVLLVDNATGEESVVVEMASSAADAVNQANKNNPGSRASNAKPDAAYMAAANAVNVAIRLATQPFEGLILLPRPVPPRSLPLLHESRADFAGAAPLASWGRGDASATLPNPLAQPTP